MEDNEVPICCRKNKEGGFVKGLVYGTIPHIGCIAFIVFTILGVTAASSIFKPLLLNAYFFYILILISMVFATVSAIVYLKRNKLLSFSGIRKKKKYLSILYGTTILINLFLFMIIFPLVANLNSGPTITGFAVKELGLSEMTLKVSIPCPGHAPLINEELKNIKGVESVKFKFPNLFDVIYDPIKTSKQQILSLDVFNEYKAEIVTNKDSSSLNPNSGGCCGSGGCGSTKTGVCGCG